MQKRKLFFTAAYWVIFMLLLAVLGFLCVYKLGHAPIQNWDEARHGVSAYEMLKNREWIVTTYQSNIDYWNLKPPMSEWCIALGYQIFGFSRFGLRIYSAGSMVLTALLCALFALKNAGKFSALVVLLGFSASTALLFEHCARAGDADALFLLFSTAALLALCEYYIVPSRCNVWLYGACLCFSLAFLTKSWHAGCIGLLVLASLIFSKRLFRFTFKNWLLCILCAAGPILLWAAARFAKDGTAFFACMLQYDLLRRTSSALEGHDQQINYYIKFLWEQKSFIVLSIFSAFAFPRALEREKKSTRYLLLSAVVFPLILFTCASSKLFWYIFCIFPPMILLAAFGANELVCNAKKYSFRLATVVLPVCMLLLCICDNLDIAKQDSPADTSTALLGMLRRTEEFSGRNIFCISPWEQCEVLAVQLGGDMVPQNGSTAAWYQDETAYLFTTVDALSSIDAPHEIASEYGPYCVIQHS